MLRMVLKAMRARTISSGTPCGCGLKFSTSSLGLKPPPMMRAAASSSRPRSSVTSIAIDDCSVDTTPNRSPSRMRFCVTCSNTARVRSVRPASMFRSSTRMTTSRPPVSPARRGGGGGGRITPPGSCVGGASCLPVRPPTTGTRETTGRGRSSSNTRKFSAVRSARNTPLRSRGTTTVVISVMPERNIASGTGSAGRTVGWGSCRCPCAARTAPSTTTSDIAAAGIVLKGLPFAIAST